MRLLFIAALLSLAAFAQPTLPNAVPAPWPEMQFLDEYGKPLAGSKLCTYAASTTTPLATYTDSTAATPNANPIILDVAGRASVWISGARYKFVLRTGGDATCTTGSVVWTQDNIIDTALYFVNYVKSVGTVNLLTYKATGTGSVLRNANAKMEETASAADYGDTPVTTVLNRTIAAYTALNYGLLTIPPTIASGQPTHYPDNVQWFDQRFGSAGTPITDADSRLPNLYLKRNENTHEYDSAGDILIGNSPAESVLRVETVTGDNSADRFFNVISQTFDKSKPIAFPLQPSSVNVAGYFAAYTGSGGVKSSEALNPLVQWDDRPNGTCTTNGTTVTRATGTSFDTGGAWENTGIDINSVVYTIASVTDGDNLELTSTAGVQTVPVDFTVGGAIFGIEVDVANRWRDVPALSAVSYNGIGIVSGHNFKPYTGLSIAATQGATNAWRRGIDVNFFTEYGFLLGNPASTHAIGLWVQPGSAANAIEALGPIYLHGRSSNLLYFTPSTDSPNSVLMFGTESTGTNVLWTLAQSGAMSIPSVRFSADNGVTPGLTLKTAAAGDGAYFFPTADTPSAVELYGTNAAQDTVKWYITQGGAANFSALTAQSGTGTNVAVFVVAPSTSTSTGVVGQIAVSANYFYVCDSANHWIRFAKDGGW